MTHEAPQLNDHLVNEPDASRLIFGLRDTGYNFKTAAADIIDNAISANADAVFVEVVLNTEGKKLVCFGDNGTGMDLAGVHSAMRYGAPQRESKKSLGKFGLGLKTASSSVCRRFTVVSRQSRSSELAKLAWDLDHVAATGRWEMLSEPVTEHEASVYSELCGDTGTLVLWEKCDRLLNREYDSGGVRELAALRRVADGLTRHLSLVFHRFLDRGDTRERDVALYVNQVAVPAWNPFYPKRAEQVLSRDMQKLEIERTDGSTESATIRAWILPHRRDMTREEEQVFARISNRSQGFYIYREGRLIQDGGWMNVFGSPEPHTSLLRIEFDFGHELDDAFKIDVKKSHILFDPGLEDGLRERLQPVYREAGQRYRRTSRDQANASTIDHTSANKNIADAPTATKPHVETADSATQSTVVSNNRGPKIRIRRPVQNYVSPDTIYVEAVDTIQTGELWQPAFRSVGDSGHVPAVLLNKHHDFYQKIYQRAAENGYAVDGMDLLFWAFAVAEQNNTSDELEPIFLDMREEISGNLRKLLRHLPDPEPGELGDKDAE